MTAYGNTFKLSVMSHFCVIILTLFVMTRGLKNLHLSDLSRLVVTSENCDSILEAYLEGNQKSDGLDGVVPSVYVIAHKEVVGVGGLSTNLEQLTQVVELAMDITANGDWSTHLLYVGLIDKDFFCLKRNGKVRDLA